MARTCWRFRLNCLPLPPPGTDNHRALIRFRPRVFQIRILLVVAGQDFGKALEKHVCFACNTTTPLAIIVK